MRFETMLCGILLALGTTAARADEPATPTENTTETTEAPAPARKRSSLGRWSPTFVNPKAEADDDDDGSILWKNRNRTRDRKNRNTDTESEDTTVRRQRGALERLRRERLGLEDDDDDDGRRTVDFKDAEDQFEVDDD